ncbi:hypothetical protein B6S66_22630 [Citrobacter werkmanii]|nr:hypothetical protein BO998_11725 [Citrobacter werkmanii]OSP15129.1 hypothetical protein B6S66_22630 [Citrobacter werkmanii]
MNPCIVRALAHALSSFVCCFHFACLSWRQVVGLRVGLASNVTIIRLRDKTKSLRIRNCL